MDPYAIFSCLFLLCCFVCSLQPWSHLMGNGCHLDSLVCCVFLCLVTFLCGVPSQVWFLIVSSLDLCLLPLYCVSVSFHVQIYLALPNWFWADNKHSRFNVLNIAVINLLHRSAPVVQKIDGPAYDTDNDTHYIKSFGHSWNDYAYISSKARNQVFAGFFPH